MMFCACPRHVDVEGEDNSARYLVTKRVLFTEYLLVLCKRCADRHTKSCNIRWMCRVPRADSPTPWVSVVVVGSKLSWWQRLCGFFSGGKR